MATKDDLLAQMSEMPIGALIALKNSGSITPKQETQVEKLIDDWFRAHYGRSARELAELPRWER